MKSCYAGWKETKRTVGDARKEFELNPLGADEVRLWPMKSRCDEVLLCRVKRDETDRRGRRSLRVRIVFIKKMMFYD